jgi:ribosomal protein S18 acetylase RimI-like enzyme
MYGPPESRRAAAAAAPDALSGATPGPACATRRAGVEDIDALVGIENRSFDTDRLSRRNFKYILTRAHAETLLAEAGGEVRGYALVLFNRGTSLARLYSFAVDPAHRGRGVGRALLVAGEAAAREHDTITMRLEVRRDNAAAIALFTQHGYKQFGVFEDYYEDHMQALRLEKRLVANLRADLVRVPYYQQTLDFTCGPAALMMGMKALAPALALSRALELRIWRESTTIFMTSGHGGCGPYGLALSAHHRGFDVEVYVNDEGALFLDSVRSPEKKEVIRLVQLDMLAEIQDSAIRLTYGSLGVQDLQEKFEQGGIPIVLVSSYMMYQEKFPHWLVVTGFDDRYVYVHDPFVDAEAGKGTMDCINMPIPRRSFERMARYGKAGQKAVLILRKPSEPLSPQ